MSKRSPTCGLAKTHDTREQDPTDDQRETRANGVLIQELPTAAGNEIGHPIMPGPWRRRCAARTGGQR